MYKHDDRLEIVIKPKSEFGKLNLIAIHLKTDRVEEIVDYMQDADRDGFDLIVVYSDKLYKRYYKELCTNKKGRIWDKLEDLLDGVDIRCGMVQRQFGQYLGDGFTLFDWH